MKTLIYSYLGLTTDPDEASEPLIEMYDLWWRHLRGPGRYQGDIILFSNLPGLERPDVQVRPILTLSHIPDELFYARVQNYPSVPASAYDVVLQTDLDVLAIRDVAPLFQLTTPFQAATSGLPLFHAGHLGNARNFPMDFWRRYLPGAQHRLGVSASVFACAGAHWSVYMRRWAELVNRYRSRALPFHDQTLLNLAYARQTFPIQPYPVHYIRHQDWASHPEAILWHFPIGDIRLDVMRQHAVQ